MIFYDSLVSSILIGAQILPLTSANCCISNTICTVMWVGVLLCYDLDSEYLQYNTCWNSPSPPPPPPHPMLCLSTMQAQETLRMQDLEDQAKLDEAKADDAAAMALTAGAAAASRMDSPGETEEAHELQESSGEVNPSALRAESEDPESS